MLELPDTMEWIRKVRELEEENKSLKKDLLFFLGELDILDPAFEATMESRQKTYDARSTKATEQVKIMKPIYDHYRIEKSRNKSDARKLASKACGIKHGFTRSEKWFKNHFKY